MFFPSAKPVRKAYSGMDISTTPLTDDIYFDAQRRGASSIMDRASNSRGTGTFASGLSKASSGSGSGLSAAGVAGAVGGAYNGVTGIIDAIKSEGVNRDALIKERNDKVAYGAGPNVGRATLKAAGSGAAAGAAIGSIIPGVGTVIGGAAGAVVGGAIGFFGGKSQQRKYRSAMRDRQKELTRVRNEESGAAYLTQTFATGGAIAAPESKSGEKAVVLGGNLHEDGGNPIIDAKTGEKIVETEREELLFTSEQSQQIETAIAAFDKSGDELELIKLGNLIKSIVDTQMIDNSGVYEQAKA